MYHLLRPTSLRGHRMSGRLAMTRTQPGEPDPGAIRSQEHQPTSPPADRPPDREPPMEQEGSYTIIGEPVAPADAEPTVIVVKNLPVPIEDQQEAEDEETMAETPLPPRATHHRVLLAPLGWTLSGFVLVLVAILVVTQLLPWWTPSAIVTIVPKTQPIRVTFTAHLVEGTADPARHEVQGRYLATLTMSQQQTVATTGHGYHQAQVAAGWLVLYNALDSPQTIWAGTHITGRDSVQVTTDTTVTIPAGTLASNGQAWVHAHAAETGPGGNIAAEDIHGPCCRADVLAANPAPFTGGMDARAYRAVNAQDIERPASALKTTLMQQVAAAYQAQLESSESLVEPVSCAAQATADHAQGSEAAQVTVTVTEACQGRAYQSVQMQALVAQAVQQQSQEGSYHLSGTLLHMQMTTSRTHVGDLQVEAQGILVYQWSVQQQAMLAALIAGKSVREATALLLQQPGVSTVSTRLVGRDTGTLPDDPSRIHFAFLLPETNP